MDFAFDLILLPFSLCQVVKADSFSPQGPDGLDAEILQAPGIITCHSWRPCGPRRRSIGRAEAELEAREGYRPCALNMTAAKTEGRTGADQLRGDPKPRMSD